MKNKGIRKFFSRSIATALALALTCNLCVMPTYAEENQTETVAVSEEADSDPAESTGTVGNESENETPEVAEGEGTKGSEESADTNTTVDNTEENTEETTTEKQTETVTETDTEKQNTTETEEETTEEETIEEETTEEETTEEETTEEETEIVATDYAHGDTLEIGGKSVTNGSWTFENGTLTVYGEGDLPLSAKGKDTPWYINGFGESVTTLVIEEGITGLNARDFYYLPNVTRIELPNSLTSIDNMAFGYSGANQIQNATVGYGCATSKKLINSGKTYGAASLTWDSEARAHEQGTDGYCKYGCGTPFDVTEEGISFSGGTLENGKWSFKDGVLTVSGTGVMPESGNGKDTPWYNFADLVTEIVVEEGITEIGKRNFYYLTNVTHIELPSSLQTIQIMAFGYSEVNRIKEANVSYGCATSKKLINSSKTYGAASLTWDSEARAHEQGTDGYCKYGCGTPFDVTEEGISFSDGTLENGKWSFKDGVLTVSGNGVMPDSEKGKDTPWYNFADLVTTLVIEEGITEIGARDFYYLTNVERIELPSSLQTISKLAFGYSGTNQIQEATVGYGCTTNKKLIGKTYGAVSLTWDSEARAHVKGDNGYCKYGCGTPIDVNGDGVSFNDGTLENGKWSFKDGVLTVSGTGAIPDSDNGKDTPWYSVASKVTKIVIEEGITEIGAKDFYYLTEVTNIELPSSLTSIDNMAFGSSVGNRIGKASVYYFGNVKESNYGAAGLTWNKYIATVSGVNYTSLEDALNAEGKTVELISDASVESEITLGSSKTVNMNGYTITVNGTLNITSGDFDGKFATAGTGTISISGGTFTYEPNAEYIAEGYIVKQDGEKFKVTDVVKITVINATNHDSEPKTYNTKVGTSFHVTADEKYSEEEGTLYYFEKWIINTSSGEPTESTSRNYSFVATNDITLEAKYAEEISNSVTFTLTASQTTSGAKNAIYYTASRSVTGYDVVAAGYVYCLNSSKITDLKKASDVLKIENVGRDGYTYVKAYTIETENKNGINDLTISVGTKTGAYVYIRAYVELKDSKGNTYRAYSDPIKESYKSVGTNGIISESNGTIK